jgi:hypothetical protein
VWCGGELIQNIRAINFPGILSILYISVRSRAKVVVELSTNFTQFYLEAFTTRSPRNLSFFLSLPISCASEARRCLMEVDGCQCPVLRSQRQSFAKAKIHPYKLTQANFALLPYRVHHGVPAGWHLTDTRYKCSATTKIQCAVLSLASSRRTHRSACPETQVQFTSP